MVWSGIVAERGLWVAVVMQAAEDIRTEERGSYHYAQSESFFTGIGEWARSREDVADSIDLHPDDLMRLGRAAIAARCLRDGDAAATVPEVSVTGVVQPSRPVPVLLLPAPAEPRPRGRPRKPTVAHDRDWWIKQFMEKQAA
jgi:hypothetical protein